MLFLISDASQFIKTTFSQDIYFLWIDKKKWIYYISLILVVIPLQQKNKCLFIKRGWLLGKNLMLMNVLWFYSQQKGHTTVQVYTVRLFGVKLWSPGSMPHYYALWLGLLPNDCNQLKYFFFIVRTVQQCWSSKLAIVECSLSVCVPQVHNWSGSSARQARLQVHLPCSSLIKLTC